MMLVASIEKNDPALLRRGRKPLVGYVSQRNTIAVTNLHDRTRIEVDWKTRALVIGAGLLFGPGLAALFIVSPDRFTRVPIFIQIVLVAVIAGMSILLVRTLVRRPRVDLMNSGDVIARDPAMTIPRDRIRGVSIETDMYADSEHRIFTPNSVLVLRTADGDVRLCASPDSHLIETLAGRVAALTRTELTK